MYLNSATLANKVSSILRAEEGCLGQDLLEMTKYLHLHVKTLKFTPFESTMTECSDRCPVASG